MSGDNYDSKTLYVGNLSLQITEEFMRVLFSQMGNCVGCKMIYEPGQDPYCFVEFADHFSASQALATMNGREVIGKPMRVNWATSPNSKNENRKVDTSDHYHIFVGDLSPDIETRQLREAFSAFGEVSDCKIIKDAVTSKSKGYGFVSFVNKEEAQKSINEMNGAWLGSRAIRTNWATRKPPAPIEKSGSKSRSSENSFASRSAGKLNYDEIFGQASDTNCTVYIGGIQTGLTDELLKQAFAGYGTVHEVRVFADKGYAFVRFDSKESACRAIVEVNGAEVGGYTCRCAWGKESNDSGFQYNSQYSNQAWGSSAQPSYYNQVGGQQGNSWGYPQYSNTTGAGMYGAYGDQQQQQQYSGSYGGYGNYGNYNYGGY